MQVAWRFVRTFLGVTFIVVGIVGLFLPILQGVLFLIVGLSLLSADSERARQWNEKLRRWVGRRKGTTDRGAPND